MSTLTGAEPISFAMLREESIASPCCSSVVGRSLYPRQQEAIRRGFFRVGLVGLASFVAQKHGKNWDFFGLLCLMVEIHVERQELREVESCWLLQQFSLWIVPFGNDRV